MDSKARIVNFIRDYMKENGWSPTVREIGDGVGLKSSSTVHGHLKTLERQNKVVYVGVRQVRVVE